MNKFIGLFKLIMTLSVFVLLSLFQNCETMNGFNSDLEYEDLHHGCPQGRLPNGDCIYLTPEDETRECTIENGTGLQVRYGNDEWGLCAVQTCNGGYAKVGNVCEFIPVVESCSIANGFGERRNNGRGFGNCEAVSCVDGYHVANKICVFTPITRSCPIANGIGQQINSGSGFGACQVTSCNAGYNALNNACVFAPITRSCVIANGTGTQTNNGTGFGVCTVTRCNIGYAVQNNACAFVRVSRSCVITNGTGVQENTGSGYGTCRVQSCNTGYRILSNACSFIPITRSCVIQNGVGTQTNSGSGFDPCRVQSCNAGYRVLNNTCSFIPVTRSCVIANGRGTQTNTGSGFSICRLSACNTGYRTVGNACVSNQRACNILNGNGIQRYNETTKQWGECTIASCNPNFVGSNALGLCVRTTAPRVKVNIHIGRMDNGTGNVIWTPDFVDMVIKKINILLAGNIVFNLNTKADVNNSRLYNYGKQEDFGRALLNLKKFTEITAVVSNPATTDASGKALNVRYNYEPYFVMRSRKNNGSEADALEVAQIFLHELGHNMGMKHDYGGEIDMDNRYVKQPQVYVDYVKGLLGCTTVTCQDRFAKFGSLGFPIGGDD